MGKWLVKACEPGKSNLLTFLRYRISFYKPTKDGSWSPNMTWFMSPSHTSAPGSKVWNRARRAWKKLCQHVQWIKPMSFEEASNASLWYNPNFNNRILSVFVRGRASTTHNHSLKKIKDVWCPDKMRVFTWLEARTRYRFLQAEDKAGWGFI